MGNFYANVTLRGPGQTQVAGACEILQLKAFVSPTVEGLTVVCDKIADEQAANWAVSARNLSINLNCPALATLNHDDDVLVYELYQNGRLVDEYNCQPGYFEDSEAEEAPSGGDPQALCKAFGMPGDPGEVERVLRAENESEFLFAVNRHAALLKALGCPPIPFESGYRCVEQQGDTSEWRTIQA